MNCPMVKLNNGVEIPQMGLGVFQAGAGAETANAVAAALEVGYRHIDTAADYGNEKDVATGIKQSGIPREDIFVTTKINVPEIRAGETLEAAKTALDLLDTAYVDLLLVHWPVDGYEAAWEALMQLYEEKKARAIGVSNFQSGAPWAAPTTCLSTTPPFWPLQKNMAKPAHRLFCAGTLKWATWSSQNL